MSSLTHPASQIKFLLPIFLAGTFSCSLIFMGSGQNPPTRKKNAEDASALGCNFEHGQVFLLTSNERGWLMCFDSESRLAWLYVAPSLVKLQWGESTPSASLHLRSQGLPDRSYYDFQGVAREAELDGNLVAHVAPPSTEVTEYAVRGRKLDQTPVAIDRTIAGRYSNVRYVEESGDLVGAELLLFRMDRGISGLVTFYESYWGEPVFASLPLRSVRVNGSQTVEFELKLEEGIGKYIATRKKAIVTLRRTDMPSAPNAEVVELLKQPHLLPEGSHHPVSTTLRE